MPALALLLAIPFLSTAPQASDVKLRGTVMTRFVKTKGASLRNRDVQWTMPATVFRTAKERRRGHEIFVHKGIALVIASNAADLREIRRRGGVASVRGRVIAIPVSQRRKGGPSHGIVIRQIRRRRQ